MTAMSVRCFQARILWCTEDLAKGSEVTFSYLQNIEKRGATSDQNIVYIRREFVSNLTRQDDTNPGFLKVWNEGKIKTGNDQLTPVQLMLADLKKFVTTSNQSFTFEREVEEDGSGMCKDHLTQWLSWKNKKQVDYNYMPSLSVHKHGTCYYAKIKAGDNEIHITLCTRWHTYANRLLKILNTKRSVRDKEEEKVKINVRKFIVWKKEQDASFAAIENGLQIETWKDWMMKNTLKEKEKISSVRVNYFRVDREEGFQYSVSMPDVFINVDIFFSDTGFVQVYNFDFKSYEPIHVGVWENHHYLADWILKRINAYKDIEKQYEQAKERKIVFRDRKEYGLKIGIFQDGDLPPIELPTPMKCFELKPKEGQMDDKLGFCILQPQSPLFPLKQVWNKPASEYFVTESNLARSKENYAADEAVLESIFKNELQQRVTKERSLAFLSPIEDPFRVTRGRKNKRLSNSNIWDF